MLPPLKIKPSLFYVAREFVIYVFDLQETYQGVYQSIY